MAVYVVIRCCSSRFRLRRRVSARRRSPLLLSSEAGAASPLLLSFAFVASLVTALSSIDSAGSEEVLIDLSTYKFDSPKERFLLNGYPDKAHSPLSLSYSSAIDH
ncbi:unnamed protein product [Victoria cruziana]